MNRKPPAPPPFEMFFVKPALLPSSNNAGQYIEKFEFFAGNTGEKVTAKVPAVGEEHQYTYTIPGGMAGKFVFKHSGRFALKPTYDGNPSGNGEGSARAHGENATGGNTGMVWETVVNHPAAHERTVTWKISYIEFGDLTVPYTVEIHRIS